MSSTNRTSRNAPIIDLSAIKYIRVIIATYIMAVGLGLLNGFDVNAYFGSFMSNPLSLYAGKVFVTFCAIMLFLGYFLRFVSLSLAIVILASSVQLNLITPVQGSIDAFWTDIVLICCLLACYCPLSARQLRKQALVKLAPMTGKVTAVGSQKVVPRRVSRMVTTRSSILNLNEAGQKLTKNTITSIQHDRMIDRFDSLLTIQENTESESENIFA